MLGMDSRAQCTLNACSNTEFCPGSFSLHLRDNHSWYSVAFPEVQDGYEDDFPFKEVK